MKECVSVTWIEEDKGKNPHRPVGPAEELEQEYETDIMRGLAAAEVNRRLAENPLQYLTKEKKRSWLRSIKQECLDPLFFFLIFLSVFLCITEETGWQLALGFLLLVSALKGRQVLDNYKFLQHRKQLLLSRVQVLRDGCYTYIDAREIVAGDILRLKKGQKVPTAVCSLTLPGVIYEKGRCFPEEAGKVIAARGLCFVDHPQKNKMRRLLAEAAGLPLPLRVQEWLARQGVIAMDTARLPDFARKEKRVVLLDTEYFPSPRKPHLLREMFRELKKEEIPYVFFTDKTREDAYKILKPLFLDIEERDIIDRKEFSCYGKEDYERQRKSIRVYAGLREEEKRRVVEAWAKDCQWVSLLANQTWDWRPAAAPQSLVAIGLLHHQEGEREFYFSGHWGDGFFRLLQTASLWHKYIEKTERIQQKVLIALCIFNGAMLLGGCSAQSPETFVWMFLFSTTVCGGLAVWKEWRWRRLRRERK